MTRLFARSKRRRLFVESLESRTMLTTLSVDINDASCGAPGDNLYCLIQEAVDAASSGDNINVHAGTYPESVNISTDNLDLGEADPNANPVIDAAGLGNGVVVDAHGVTINGLEVQNASLRGFLINGNNTTLTDNTARDNAVDGFFLGGASDNNTLTGNTAIDNRKNGFELEGSGNTLTDNTASGNRLDGFVLAGANNNVLTNNTAQNNRNGFHSFFASGNTITGNTFRDNGAVGFLLGDRSNNNVFMNNTAQSNDVGFDMGSNSNNNTLAGNTARNNRNIGFGLRGNSSSNTLTDNTARDNGSHGFRLDISSGNTLTGNTAMGNDSVGFFLVNGSSNNTLTDNTANGNGEVGFLLLPSSENTITGNTARGNDGHGFFLGDGSNNNILTGNTATDNGTNGFVLTRNSNNNTLTGNTAQGNGLDGFKLDSGTRGNELTGNTALDNNEWGFFLGISSFNTITGNIARDNGNDGFLVVDNSNNNALTGNTALGNSGHGFFLVVNSNDNVLTKNTAQDNGGLGFFLSDRSNNNRLTDNTARGNRDGFVLISSSGNTLTSNTARDNRNDGFLLVDNSSGNTFTGNTAQGNGGGGFVVRDGSSNNAFRGNSIHSNIGLGIDLGGDGVTLNDVGDADSGPNELQNFPVLTKVEAGVGTRVVGSLNSTASTSFTIEVYGNSAADPSGHGEGEQLLGSFSVITDIAGDVAFDVTLPTATAGGELITATATDPQGNTSEFSTGTISEKIFPLPPTVNRVYVRGSSWSSDYLNTLAAAGLGDASLGYAIPFGTAQLDSLIWGNINEIYLQLSGDVSASIQPTSFELTGVNVATFDITASVHDVANFIMKLSLTSTLGPGRLKLTMHDSVQDAVGNALDGEWTDSVSTGPSGNGVAGGDFVFGLDVLPGDADADGHVAFSDFLILGRNFGLAGKTFSDGDFDGDGQVQFSDFIILSANFGKSRQPVAAPALSANSQTLPPTDISAADDLFGRLDDELSLDNLL